MAKKNWLDSLSPRWLQFGINCWPPFVGCGIKIEKINPDYRYIRVIIKPRFYNKNYVGTHFGGSMFAMTDPFYMLMLMKNLGSEYIVWDKKSVIDFKKPARGVLTSEFIFGEEELLAIKQQADIQPKYIFDKPIDILNADGVIVASVIKTLYVRRKSVE